MIVRASLGISLSATVLVVTALTAGADPITVTDLKGRKLELAKPAERIVTFPVPMPTAVIAIDKGVDRLVGIHPESATAIDDGLLGEFFPAAKNINSGILAGGATKGRQPNVEAIAALRPDFVIQWGHAGEDNIKPLENAGLSTALLVYGSEDNVRDALRMVGTAIGKPGQVDTLIAWRDATAARIEKGLAGLAEGDKPRVAYFFYARTALFTEGKGTYADWQLRHVGAVNAAAGIDNWKEVSLEQVAAWNPDVIFMSTFESDLHVDRFYKDPVLGETNAGKNRRVYQVPLGGYRWDPGSPESPLAWMWYADVLHPGRFDFDIRAEIAEWYPKLYGHTPTREQVDKILHMDMNSGSAGYERFAAK